MNLQEYLEGKVWTKEMLDKNREKKSNPKQITKEIKKPNVSLKTKSLNKIREEYTTMGLDLGKDFLSDPNNVDKFDEWAESSAGDSANEIASSDDKNDKLNIVIIKKSGVSDVIGYIANLIHDGMMQAKEAKSIRSKLTNSSKKV